MNDSQKKLSQAMADGDDEKKEDRQDAYQKHMQKIADAWKGK
jgi:hypothetical protein